MLFWNQQISHAPLLGMPEARLHPRDASSRISKLAEHNAMTAHHIQEVIGLLGSGVTPCRYQWAEANLGK